MAWIAFSLLAPFFWTGSNFIDKYVLDRHSKGIIDYLFFSSTITFLPICAVLVAMFGFPEITPHSWIPVAAGAMLLVSYGFYARALQVGDTSTIVVLYKLIPVLTLTLAFLFLGQTLSVRELAGFFIILVGAIAVSLDGKLGKLMNGFWMILIAMIMWAGITLFTDYGLTKIEYWDYAILEAFGTALAGLAMFAVPAVRRRATEGLRGASRQKYAWFTMNNIIDFGGHLAINQAFALAPSAALVTVVMQVQSVYAVAMGAILTTLLPTIIKEDISKGALVKKALAAGVMFVGIVLLVL